jgi:hypothetical protein
VRRIALAALAFFVVAPAAHAADCVVRSSVSSGRAPLKVTYTAACAAATLHWDFGDGQTADGPSVAHVYRQGAWAPKLTTEAGTQALPAVRSIALVLHAPHRADYGAPVTLRATVVPKLPVRMLSGKTFVGGKATVRATHPRFTAIAAGVTAFTTVLVRPRLDVKLVGSPTLGSSLRVRAVLRPAHAGSVRVRVDGRATNLVPTARARLAHIVVSTVPHKGWAGPGRTLTATVVEPSLGPGSRGPSVRVLEQRLRELHYALRGVDGYYGQDDVEAVLAFQKVNGLSRTGRMDSRLWARLTSAAPPRARYGGTHVEVDKTRQVLFMVKDGKVDLVLHVSTGATGNTPLGLWHVYLKVPGWNGVLWYPSFFLRGFAIHGYPEVPAYPASHGCVRIPMWIAPTLYSEIPGDFSIYVYN